MPTNAKGSAITVSVRAKKTATVQVDVANPARNGLVGFAYFVFVGEVANQQKSLFTNFIVVVVVVVVVCLFVCFFFFFFTWFLVVPMMHGYGDSLQPKEESLDVMEDIVLDFISNLVRPFKIVA